MPNPETEFFIAISKSGVHSYVTLGRRIDKTIEVLAAFGKEGDDQATTCGLVFWDTSAYIKNERNMVYSSFQYVITYKAYAITYEQYLEFLKYMRTISLEQQKRGFNFPLMAYLPETSNRSLNYKTVDNLASSSDNPADITRYRRIGLFGNTCRQSAIQLTKRATNRHDLGSGISHLYFKAFPLTAMFQRGRIKDTPYFYILPLPPTAFEGTEPKKLKVLTMIYKRLDKMILSEQQNPVTIEKFEKLKNLYNELSGDNKASIVDVMQAIEKWESDNVALIATHRKSHWLSFQTATQKLFAAIRKEFEALRESSCTKLTAPCP